MFSKMKLANNTNLESERNLCFVNTALQLLHCVPHVNIFFKTKEYRLPKEQKRQMKICDEISRLFNSAGNCVCSAAELRRLVANKSGRHYLQDGSQQDTVEFLLTLLQEVEEEISVDNWEARIVVQEFWGVERKEKKYVNRSGICSKCKSGPRDEVEKMQVLQLDIPNTSRVITLNGVLENYFSESSDTAKMKCNCCTHKTKCPATGACKPKGIVSKRVLVKSPDILILQINRYLDLSGAKIKTTVWPDDSLKLPSGEEFKLLGIGHHLGEYFSSGHYVASIKSDTEWIRCNDTQISKSNESDSKSIEINICIYLKVFHSTSPFIPTDEWQNLKGRTVPGGLHYSFGLKGNYARNMNPGEGITVKKHISPIIDRPISETNLAGNLQKGVGSKGHSSDLMEDEGWTTPQRSREFSTKRDQFTKPNNRINRNEEAKEDDPKEQCKSCGKKFKLLFSHLSRSKGCQSEYDMDGLREEIKIKRRELNKKQMKEERNKKRKEDEDNFKAGRAAEKSKERNAKRKE